MFTHLTETTTRQWLHCLSRHLKPEGVLVTTYRGRKATSLYRARGVIAKMADRLEAGRQQTGWGFEKYDPAAPAEWGVSLASPAKLAEIGASIPDTHIGGIRESGWQTIKMC